MTERISDAEHAVMEVLWDESPLTAQEVSERVPAEERAAPLARRATGPRPEPGNSRIKTRAPV